MKDDKIDKLLKSNLRLESKVDEQSEQIADLLGYAKYTKETLHEVQDDLTETKEQVNAAKSYLEEKSKTSTKNPSDKRKHHYFGATTYIDGNGKQVVKFITGQKFYVDRTIDKKVRKENHKVIIKPFYNANGIDLRHNVMEEFLKRRDERLKEINAAIVMKDNAANAQLIKEIRKYNKLNPLKKRVYSEEKQTTPLVKKRDISVTFTTLSFAYEINKHIGFNEVLQIILDVNNLTQESPLNSDDE